MAELGIFGNFNPVLKELLDRSGDFADVFGDHPSNRRAGDRAERTPLPPPPPPPPSPASLLAPLPGDTEREESAHDHDAALMSRESSPLPPPPTPFACPP